jgi:hypothetical protein
MKPAPPSPTSVEHFAEIVAHLAAPFAVREAVLRDAGLDERAWTQLEAQWTVRLAADGALVDRYIARYAAATQAPSTSPAEGAPPIVENAPAESKLVLSAPALPPTPSPERPPLVAMPPSGLRLDGTLEPEDGAALRAVLPFVKGSPAARFTAPTVARPPADLGRPDATLELGASLPLPLPRAAPEIAVPGKRLHRFDSKTGAPLPVPVWTDDPADPKKPA